MHDAQRQPVNFCASSRLTSGPEKLLHACPLAVGLGRIATTRHEAKNEGSVTDPQVTSQGEQPAYLMPGGQALLFALERLLKALEQRGMV